MFDEKENRTVNVFQSAVDFRDVLIEEDYFPLHALMTFKRASTLL